LLVIQDLHVKAGEQQILNGVNLQVNPGEIHAIMGPNGSGKSTLAHTLAGNPAFQVTHGTVTYQGKNLLQMPPEIRAREGIFLAFQYPIELPGVRNWQFLRSSLDAIREYRGLAALGVREFDRLFEDKRHLVGMDSALTRRSVNEGYSGGEKKRNEVLQMAILEPVLALLDETDSGLDIDALRIVANGVNQLRDKSRSMILVTHYQRLLDYLVPDYVHILSAGRIVHSGDSNLAKSLESQGYDWIKETMSGDLEATV